MRVQCKCLSCSCSCSCVFAQYSFKLWKFVGLFSITMLPFSRAIAGRSRFTICRNTHHWQWLPLPSRWAMFPNIALYIFKIDHTCNKPKTQLMTSGCNLFWTQNPLVVVSHCVAAGIVVFFMFWNFRSSCSHVWCWFREQLVSHKKESQSDSNQLLHRDGPDRTNRLGLYRCPDVLR